MTKSKAVVGVRQDPEVSAYGRKCSVLEMLTAWWSLHRNDPNKWRTPIGRLVRKIVEDTGHWKNRPRGSRSGLCRGGIGDVVGVSSAGKGRLRRFEESF